MKKISLYIASLLTLIIGFAAPALAEQPNRVLVINENGNYSGYAFDNLDMIALRNVEGDVSASVEVLKVDLENIWVNITKSFACEYYRFTVAPEIVVRGMNELAMIRYVEQVGSEAYDSDVENGAISGVNLKPGTRYCVMTVGYDYLNTPAALDTAYFETDPPVIEGDPKVTATLVGQTEDSFTVRFTPNKDVGVYYVMAFEEGSVDEYLQMFGPMMGCTNISELIERWYGTMPGYTEEVELTYSAAEEFYPGEIYDLVIAVKDINGNFIPEEIFQASSLLKGGEGTAEVEVKIGSYNAEDWWGEIKPSQYIKFIPNDQTSRYRTTVQYADDYDLYSEEEWREDLCQNPPQVAMQGWWFFDEFETDYQCDEDTEFVVLAAAQNINHEWGPMTIVRFKTPETCPGMPAKVAPKREKGKVASRTISDKGVKAPIYPLNVEKGLKLVK